MSDLPERVDHRQLRASDVDRERSPESCAERRRGPLDLGELDDRLRAVYASRTYAELEPILADLPTPAATPVGVDGVHPGPVTPPSGPGRSRS